eukprot:Rmarinus@m.22272
MPHSTLFSLAEKHGFHVECHTLVTEDSYEIELHRLIPKRAQEQTVNQEEEPKAMLLMHGLLESSIVWLALGEKSLAIRLASRGHDVWLGNSRGNKFCRRRRAGREDWSFERIATSDCAATLSYVYKTSGKKVHYMGQSQGATQFLIALASRPQLNDICAKCVMLAPGLVLRDFDKDHPHTMKFLHVVRAYPEAVFGTMSFIQRFLPGVLLWFFAALVMRKMGFVTNPVGKEEGVVLFRHTPSGQTSIHNLNHWVQSFGQEIRRYDFGSEKNLHFYGSESPPSYGFEEISVPLYIYFGSKENAVDVPASMRMAQQRLPSVVRFVVQEGYSHADFLWSKHASNDVYGELVETMVSE